MAKVPADGKWYRGVAEEYDGARIRQMLRVTKASCEIKGCRGAVLYACANMDWHMSHYCEAHRPELEED